MNILITRPLIDAEDLMEKFFSLGHKIIHLPNQSMLKNLMLLFLQALMPLGTLN
jgi:hypothetical protein